jgi:ferredoxin
MKLPSRFATLRSRKVVQFAAKYKVTVQVKDKEYQLTVADNCSILEAALDAGIELPHDCKLGVCLTCPSKVVSGKIDQTGSTLDDSVIERGFALTCMSFPRSDCVVKAIEEDELVSAQFARES